MCPTPHSLPPLPLGFCFAASNICKWVGEGVCLPPNTPLPTYLPSLLSREFYTFAETMIKRSELWDSHTPVATGLGYFACLNWKVLGTVWIYRWRGSWVPSSLRQVSKEPQAWKKELPPWVGLPDVLREKERWCPITFEFHVNSKVFWGLVSS